MTQNKEKISEILKQFQEYLETEEAKKHLETMESEKREVKALMQKLSSFDKKSMEFTELIIYGLLPYNKTKVAKRVSLFPTFMNIKLFFKDYNYSDEDWNKLANMIYELCLNFQINPENLNHIIKQFSDNKYSQRLQCGSITPILFCLNDKFPVVNNRIIRSFRRINLILGINEKLSQKLEKYPENLIKLNDFVKRLDFDLLRKQDYFDLFCYWYDSNILLVEKEDEKEESEQTIEEPDKEEYTKPIEVDFKGFIEEVDLSDVSKFSPHFLRNPERIKIKDIIHSAEKGIWVLPNFQRYFDWKKEHIRSFLESIFNDY
ncbi:MAG: DUF262 domain-containing protein [Candidatus Methanoperedens sp.]|nr:DUF262 domain-containing protein [Candidatus Methanoperedens sp.]